MEDTTIFNPFLDDDEDETPRPREPWEREYSPEQVADMKARKADGELLPGHKRAKSTYRRRDITDKDLFLMQHIGGHKGCSSGIASALLGVTQRTAHRRLLGLKEFRGGGLVNSHEVPGARMFWYLTPRGRNVLAMAGAASHDDLTVGRPEDFNIDAMGHTLAVSMTAAHLVKRIGPDPIIGETAIRRAWGKAAGFKKKKQTFGAGYAGEVLKRDVLQQIKEGKIAWDRVMAENPALWTLTSNSQPERPTKQFHHTDFVISREAGRGASPRSVAVEVELTPKTDIEYAKILRTFAQDKFVYAKVIWVVRSDSMQAQIEKVAAEVGLAAQRLGFERLLGADGTPFTGFPWTL